MGKATIVDQFEVPAGKAYWNPRDRTTGQLRGERYLGLTPTFQITIASSSIEIFSSETSVRELADRTITGITRTGQTTVQQISNENLADWIIADISTVAQAVATVLDERIVVDPDRYYQLGMSADNPTGVRKAPLDALTLESDDAVAWVATTATTAGDLVKPTGSPTRYYKALTTGDTGGTEPTASWGATATGDRVQDGDVLWEDVGPIVVAPTVTTDYAYDSETGRLYTVAGGVFVPGTPILVDYNTEEWSWDRLATAELIEAEGALRVISDNTKGDNRDWYFPKVTLGPSGNKGLKLETPAYSTMTFDMAFQKPSPGPAGQYQAAIYVDGRPYKPNL